MNYDIYIIGLIIVVCCTVCVVSWGIWKKGHNTGYKEGHTDGFNDGVTNCKATIELKKILDLEVGLWITSKHIARDYLNEVEK